jgi:hypothetical protein
LVVFDCPFKLVCGNIVLNWTATQADGANRYRVPMAVNARAAAETIIGVHRVFFEFCV